MRRIKSKRELEEVYDCPIIRHYLAQCGFEISGVNIVGQDRTLTLTDKATGVWLEVKSVSELQNLLS